MDIDAKSAGFKNGFPKIWDPNRIHVYIEHSQPVLNATHANRQQALMEIVEYYN